MGKFSRLGNDLYNGRRSIDFVGRKWLWYAISGVIVLLAIAGLLVQGPELRHRVHRRRAVQRPPVRPPPRTRADQLRQAVAGTRHRRRRVPDRHHVGRRGDPRPDRAAHRRGERQGRRRDRQDTGGATRSRRSPRPRSAPAGARRSPSARCIGLVRLPGAGHALHLGLLPRVEDVGRRDRGADPRRRHHDRHLRALRLRGHPGDGDRPADHPRLLALRHRGRLRQGAREHPRACASVARRTRAQANLAVNQTLVRSHQHLDRGADPGRRDPLRRRRPARQRLAQGPRARAVRRHGRGCLLVDLHRDAAARAAEVGRERGQARREAGRRAPPRGGPVRRRAGVLRGHADPGRAHR